MEQEPGGAAAALLRQKRAALRRRGCSFESPRYLGPGGVQPRGAGAGSRPRVGWGGGVRGQSVARPPRGRESARSLGERPGHAEGVPSRRAGDLCPARRCCGRPMPPPCDGPCTPRLRKVSGCRECYLPASKSSRTRSDPLSPRKELLQAPLALSNPFSHPRCLDTCCLWPRPSLAGVGATLHSS